MRFKYHQEEVNGTPVVTIAETGGVFFGHTVEQVSKIAEDLYPNYQSHNMSNIFYDVYFNYCLRRTLEGKPIPKEYSKENFASMHRSNKIRQKNKIQETEEELD